MISYIFKNKIKNIFVTIVTTICILIQLNELHNYWILYPDFKSIAIKFISLLPYLLVFIYMITLKREYALKKWLFPISFAIFSLLTVYAIIGCFKNHTNSLEGLLTILVVVNLDIVLLASHILSLVGSISNFKRINLLRIGIVICIVFLLCSRVWYYYSTYLHAYYLWISPTIILGEILRDLVFLSFYISIFILLLTKKSENIDITPFIEERKTKKELKKAHKLEKEQPEVFTPPVIPDGYWRCMGCGKILPYNETTCDCGYKKPKTEN